MDSVADRPVKRSYVRKQAGDDKKPYSGKPYPSRERKYDDRNKHSDKGEYKNRGKKPYEKKQDDGIDRPVERYVRKQAGDDKKPYSGKPYPSRERKYDDRNKHADKGDYKNRGKKTYEKKQDDGIDRPVKRYVRKQAGDDKKPYADKPYPSRERKYDDRNKHSDKGEYKNRGKKPYEKKQDRDKDRPVERYVRKKINENDRSFPNNKNSSGEELKDKKSFSKNKRARLTEPKTYIGRKREYHETEIYIKDNTYEKRPSFRNFSDAKGIRLNKFIANAGICSRREADTLIETGVITINGKIVTQLGTKVMPGDVVKFNDQVLSGEQHQYLLLNKPKGYITTTDDPQERKTVMEIIKHACKERIYPVGRLDKNTCGLLLFTNDGELAKKLTHPSHKVEKVYKAELDKALAKADLEKIIDGIELEDGLIKVDAIAYGETKKEIGIELHSGKNRIVRRIFESLGYEVEKLDRVVFAGLTKKDLPRGKYRFLSQEEINILRRIR